MKESPLKDLAILIKEIVAKARALSEKRTDERNLPVNYACIFTRNEAEYETMLASAHQLGSIVQETTMGPVFRIEPLATEAGELRLLKIRRPDPKRPERGDADFTIPDYERFKEKYLKSVGFSLIERKDMEMIELIDPSFDVLAYYSHPTLIEMLELQIKQ